METVGGADRGSAELNLAYELVHGLNTRLPYRDIILFIYCWAYEMTSIQFCEREKLMNKNTVVDWNNYLREVCVADLLLPHCNWWAEYNS